MKMKQVWMVLLALVAMAATPGLSRAAFDVGFEGTTDLNVTQSTALQLPADGILKYRNVHIYPGVTLTFKKNEQNTPVTILASGDVLIEGTIDVSGTGAGLQLDYGKGGPGGFDGGRGGWLKQDGARGLGPGCGAGGAQRADKDYGAGNAGGGGFAGWGGTGGYFDANWTAPAGTGGQSYGNARMMPLVGGSGGGGGGGNIKYRGGAGGGGGGAILIASSGTITVKGAIRANGGAGSLGEGYWGGVATRGGGGGGGAAGAIRLVATTIAGNGPIDAYGGNGGRGSSRETYWSDERFGGRGSDGRIRLEIWNSLRSVSTNPNADIVWYPYALAPANLPSLAITSVGGVNVPAVTKGDYKSTDISLPPDTRSPVTVIVTATNIPIGTSVTVKAQPEFGNSIKSASATLTGTDTSSTAAVQLDIPIGYASLLTVSATFQAATAALEAPIFADGEKVAQIRVDSQLSGASTVTYITESGREIPATL